MPELPEPIDATPSAKQSWPWLTWTAVGLCVAATFAYQYGGGNSVGALARRLAVGPELIWNGYYFALFTSVFVHAAGALGIPWHLLFNMLYLFQLGSILERSIDRVYWIAFFVVCAIVSAGAELAFAAHNAIGASGVVYGMFGLMWAGRYQYREWAEVATKRNMAVLLIWGLFCIVATLLGLMRVANYAHAAGFLFGLAVGWLFVAQKRTVLAAVVQTVLWTIAVLSATWLPWSHAWTFWFGERELSNRHYDAAVVWLDRSLTLGHDRKQVLSLLWKAEAGRGNRAAALAILRELQ